MLSLSGRPPGPYLLDDALRHFSSYCSVTFKVRREGSQLLHRSQFLTCPDVRAWLLLSWTRASMQGLHLALGLSLLVLWVIKQCQPESRGQCCLMAQKMGSCPSCQMSTPGPQGALMPVDSALPGWTPGRPAPWVGWA